MNDKAKALVSITLLEHAANLLTAAGNEGPKGKHDINGEISALNKMIHAIQQKLFQVADAP